MKLFICRLALVAIVALAFTGLAVAKNTLPAGQNVTYQDGDVALEGYVARPVNTLAGGKSPVVMIVHQWKGLGAYEKRRADMLAQAGYIAFAIDMYGKGVRPASDKDAGAEAGKYKNDPALARQRLTAALDFAKTLPKADASRIAVIGYCFGGGMALELARSGADIVAAISFHGNLASKAPVSTPGIIKAAIQVHQGADDPMVKQDEVSGFINEMKDAKADWTLTQYGNAVHGFSDEHYGDDPGKGVAYNEKADRRSWESALDFLKAAFKT